MIIHCKNTFGDGTVVYVDYEVDDPEEVEEEPTVEDKAEAYDILTGGAAE